MFTVRVFLLVCGLALSAPRLAGQASAPEPCPPPRSYDQCGLRVEPGWGGIRIVRGREGVPVGALGPFSSDLGRLVQESDSARAYVRAYQADQTAAVALSLLGGAVLTATSLRTAFDSDAQFIGLVVGGGITLAGAHFAIQAQQAVARVVWWYNRSLTHSP